VERLGQAHRPAAGDREFHRLGNPFASPAAPFVSGVEFFGGLFLLLGLLTRISAGALGITMIVAIRSAKWAEVDSLETLLGFDEFEYLALFLWLAIAGPGVLSVDHCCSVASAAARTPAQRARAARRQCGRVTNRRSPRSSQIFTSQRGMHQCD